jgi:heptosyltransferase-2
MKLDGHRSGWHIMSGGGTPRFRTLVIGVNWLGDTVMSMPALLSIVEASPEHDVHVAAPRVLTPLLAMAAPVQTIGWSQDDSTHRRIQRLKEERFDRAIILPNSFRSAWIARWAGIPERWGYAGRFRGWLLNRSIGEHHRPRGIHQSQQYLELARHIGGDGIDRCGFLQIPPGAMGWAAAVCKPETEGHPVIGIGAGAHYGPAKRWHADRFAEVARALRDRYRARIVLVGDRRERTAAPTLASEIGHGVLDLRGRTNLEQLAALLKRCALVICNDSGPMHLASAVGTPVVALFGSTDPVATGPMGSHRIVRAAVDCAPCLKRRCPKTTYQCLEAIQPDEVLAAAADFFH